MQVSAFKIEKYSTYMGDAGTSSRMIEMTRRTTYEWEAELAGLGWLKCGCSAGSLKGQSK